MARLIGSLVLTACAWLVCVTTTFAGDWPTWRYDANRSAASPDALPGKLHLQWTWQLPELSPAWKEDPRMYFDAGYEPVVGGSTMFVASSRNDSVTAIDTVSGEQLWRFFAGGPIRFAPVFHNGKLLFGSDDGQFYCLDAGTGKTVWQFNAAPSNRKTIGNSRLISVWPMRGGPVLADGKLQFTAGVWPFEGVLLYTLDLKSGKALDVKPKSASTTLKDIAPQGYAALSGEQLFLPCGRAKVAAFDRQSAKPIGLTYDSRGKTDYHVAALGPWMFHGDKIYNVQDKLLADVEARRPVLTAKTIYSGQSGAVVAYDIANPQVTEKKDRKGKARKVISLNEQWKLSYAEITGKAAGEEKKWLVANPLTIHIKAGDRLYGHQAGRVFSVDLPSGDRTAQQSWSAPIEGTPSTMLAANDRLFVVTLEGRFYCFGAEQREPRHHQAAEKQLASTDPAAAKKAAQILKASQAEIGYAVVMGINQGTLVEELLLQSKLPVIAIDADAAKIDALRRRLDATGLYGTRVSAHAANPITFGLPPYLASLVASEDSQAGAISQPAETVMASYQMLRPYGGTVCFNTSPDEHDGLVQLTEFVGLRNAEIRRDGNLSLLTKVGALPGSANWTHEYGDTSNTLMSRDKLVKAPLGVLWFGGPASSGDLFYNRHFWGPSLAVIGGRMFLQGPGKLTAVDVYTGQLLWQVPLVESKEIRPGRRGNNFEKMLSGFNFVAVEDGIYLVSENICRRYDPATGKTLSEFKLAADEGEWGRFRIYEDLLITELFREVKGKGRLPVELRAVDRNSGELVWKKQAKFSFPFFAIDGGKAYCFDGMIEDLYLDWKRRGKIPAAGPDRDLVSLDVKTGKEIWRYSTDMVVTWLAYSQENDVLLVSNNKGMIAYRGKDGSELWRKYSQGKGFAGHPENLWDRVILWKNRVLDQRGPGYAYDIQTGESSLRKHPVTGEEVPWEFTKKGHHCNYAIANEHLMTFRAADAGFCDISTGTTGRLTGFRSGCRNSLIPADGVLNAPNMAHGCICGYSIFTSLALVNVPDADLWTYSALKNRDERPRQFAVNFGAPGDRLDSRGTMWLDYPSVGGDSPDLEVKLTGENARYFRNHTKQVRGKGLRWVAASGVEGATSAVIKLPGKDKSAQNYTVRLHFTEPAETSAGNRVFDVALQDEVLLSGLDVAKESGGTNRTLVKEFKQVTVEGELKITLTAKTGSAVLCGVELIAEK